jgi:hypothetical protein
MWLDTGNLEPGINRGQMEWCLIGWLHPAPCAEKHLSPAA